MAVLASVVDPFDQEFKDASLVAGGEGVPGVVEVGEEVSDIGLVDLVGSECGEFVVDLGQAAFGGPNRSWKSELGDSLCGTRQTGCRLQIGVVGSQLVLERGAFFGQVGDADFGLESTTTDGSWHLYSHQLTPLFSAPLISACGVGV